MICLVFISAAFFFFVNILHSVFFLGFTLECESLTVYISLPVDDDLYPAEWQQIGADCGV